MQVAADVAVIVFLSNKGETAVSLALKRQVMLEISFFGAWQTT
ncbi:MAG: hypothetical protein R8G34_09915 [Paracoccaceae bacterium]|nr:hypothetical protein [Paracoccaceae bacterium]